MTQIKTTIGEVVTLLTKAIEHHRKKMTHGHICGEKIRLGMLSSEHIQLPMSAGEYWPIMMHSSPWNELEGIFNAAKTFHVDREMWISVKLAGYLGMTEGEIND